MKMPPIIGQGIRFCKFIHLLNATTSFRVLSTNNCINYLNTQLSNSIITIVWEVKRRTCYQQIPVYKLGSLLV